jgi:hypothetical protein
MTISRGNSLLRLGIAAILVVGLLLLFVFFGFEKKYTRKDAIVNYVQHTRQIIDLVAFFNSKVPDPNTNQGVSFGLSESSGRVDMGVFLLDGSVIEKNPNIGGSNLKISSAKMDTLLKRLGWTTETVTILMQKLESTNCRNIKSQDTESVSINFRYSGWGLHSYLIYKKPLSDSLVKWYNDMGDTVIDRNVVVKYSSSL